MMRENVQHDGDLRFALAFIRFACVSRQVNHTDDLLLPIGLNDARFQQ
jgi:hypothetical protein